MVLLYSIAYKSQTLHSQPYPALHNSIHKLWNSTNWGYVSVNFERESPREIHCGVVLYCMEYKSEALHA